MWGNIISESENEKKSPTTEIEALHYEDRRQFFKSFTEKLNEIKELRV
jgi:hypothetical protein